MTKPQSGPHGDCWISAGIYEDMKRGLEEMGFTVTERKRTKNGKVYFVFRKDEAKTEVEAEK